MARRMPDRQVTFEDDDMFHLGDRHGSMSSGGGSPWREGGRHGSSGSLFGDAALRARRTSLPASSFSLTRPAVINSNLVEARGLIVDMMAKSDLPSNVASCLRAVASLLQPNSFTSSLAHSDFGLPSVVENPYSGERILVNSSSKPRVSNITFSTVTSATGLPTIAAEPSRSRSSSYWKPDQNLSPSSSSSSEPSSTVHCNGGSGQHKGAKAAADEALANDATSDACTSRDSTPQHQLPSKKLNGEHAATPETRSSPAPRCSEKGASPCSSSSCHASKKCSSRSGSSRRRSTSRSRFDETPPHDEDKEDAAASASDASSASSRRVLTRDGCRFDCDELEADSHLARIEDWALPIFQMADKHPQTVLTRTTYKIFKHADLFRIFKLSYEKFFNYFHALERGYWEIPYHNRIHAADVLHACFYLTVHPVEPFANTEDEEDVEEELKDAAAAAAANEGTTPSRRAPFAPLAESMSNLELMALYTAAAMHDYDHPGRTNAFLVQTEDKKAILYNDRSVLENHHAAESWRLLSAPGNCFIENLDAAETRRFRYLVLEYILATDLKAHFEIILAFNEKQPWDLHMEGDRLQIARMIIKLADINSPTKPAALHRQWTDRICAEFYAQGDEEKRLGIPVTPYMDRECPKVPHLQDSFITHLVAPLCQAMHEACLLPILPGLDQPEIIINLEHNRRKWQAEMAEYDRDDGNESVNTDSSSGLGTANEPIEEEEEERLMMDENTTTTLSSTLTSPRNTDSAASNKH